jgi:integrase
MKTVQPIRDEEKITEFMIELRSTSERNFILFVVGISTAYRISDLLKLKAKDVRNRDHLTVKELKTGKQRRMPIDVDLRRLLMDYTQNLTDEEYLFKSREKDLAGRQRPLGRVMAYKILNQTARKIGLNEEIGCHTLRKTFGYHHYQKNKDAVLLMELFGHSNVAITLRYIGMTQDLIDDSVRSLRLLRNKIPAKPMK